MGNHSVDEPSTSGREVHLSSLDYDNFMTQMNDMMLALNENQKVVENLKLANKQLIKDLTMECGLNRLHNEYAEKKDKQFNDLSKYFNCEIEKLTERTEEAERKRNVLLGKFDSMEKNKQTLEEKVCQLEKSLKSSEDKYKEFISRCDCKTKDNLFIALEQKNVEITKKLSDMETLLKVEREDFRKEKADRSSDKRCYEKQILSLSMKVSELEKPSYVEKKENEEKKTLELRCLKLSKQNSDFEKVLFLEKEKLEKERVKYENQRKTFESKNTKLSKKIYELQKELDEERKELEKRKVAEFQARSVKDDFSTGRKSRKRSKKKKSIKPSTQSTNFPKHHSPRSYPNPFDSKASDIPVFKRVHMVWKVKGSTPEKDAPKSSVPKTPFNKNNVPQGKSFVKPTPIYSANHLIRLARKQICCSYCGTNDFVQKDYVQYWYGTYRVPSNRAPPNKPGPKFRWVPKSA